MPSLRPGSQPTPVFVLSGALLPSLQALRGRQVRVPRTVGACWMVTTIHENGTLTLVSMANCHAHQVMAKTMKAWLASGDLEVVEQSGAA